ncbi:hypothetical protein CLIB1444_01S00430 [[Candida] jaroonii]|uniref:Uncharacterized protein n=1 Tax=[Candida] jaroonii TaxID=467808 RepID=A0ACA9XZV7_9ASCO|nr:hypothetical protein CLIB1444_01S00430 [[Candida] jaroonii]
MDELSKTIDQFLSFTNIQNHHFGIPKVNYHSTSKSNALFAAELKYYQSYKTLISNINELIYLNELKNLQNTSNNNLNDQYDSIMKEIPGNFQDKPIEYLQSLNNFKTDTLLNTYLQITLPVLRSIHHYNDYLTSTETVIHNNLENLYSQTNGQQDVNINKILDLYNKNNELTEQYNDLQSDIKRILKLIKPKLKNLNEIDETLQSLESENNDKRLTFIKNHQYDEQAIKKLFKKLVQKWCHISILCDFLPNFILCLPLDWFDDNICNQIMEKCAELNEKYGHFQTLLNKDNIKDMTLDQLLMIDLK